MVEAQVIYIVNRFSYWMTEYVVLLGQAQAIKLGLGKALLIHNSELKPALRKGKPTLNHASYNG